MIKISLAGFAKFVTASSQTQQRTILRDHKHPKPSGRAQAKYYAPARRIITAYHANGYSKDWLEREGERLTVQASHESNRRRAAKLGNNGRAVRAYAQCAWTNDGVEVLRNAFLVFQNGEVRISVVPDLVIRHKGRTKLLKFDFTEDAIAPRKVQVVAQVLYEAAVRANLVAAAGDAIYLDVVRAKAYHGKRVGTRMGQEIEAACENIAAIWPTLKPRVVGLS